ncbi:unnamed protein product [Moneuplotes crassus]|uniref:Thioredoxin domain-containing protein n=1 Tax=Euplotes crassus TaxID=5936 RepID=A0AAD2D8P3_EUPCR|nr:unnamed protein product [Moneuplotes crassus]
MAEQLQKIRTVDEYHEVLERAGPNLVVFFFYSNWSLMSQEIEKELIPIQYELPDVNICKIDVDTNGEVSEAYSIRRMPTFVFIKQSKTLDRLSQPDIKTVNEYIDHFY